MLEKVDKLVQLALSTENVDEAIAAIKQARRMQPKGRLKADQSPDWSRFERERDQMRAERKAFEEERTAYHRRILHAEQEQKNKPGAGHGSMAHIARPLPSWSAIRRLPASISAALSMRRSQPMKVRPKASR